MRALQSQITDLCLHAYVLRSTTFQIDALAGYQVAYVHMYRQVLATADRSADSLLGGQACPLLVRTIWLTSMATDGWELAQRDRTGDRARKSCSYAAGGARKRCTSV